jgi:N-methylhydantoinase B
LPVKLGGAQGGRPGTPNYIEVVVRDGRPPLRSGKPTRVPLVPGDVVRLVAGTGGGWGDPAERPRESVARDLRDGLISQETAEQVYGYVAEGEEA